MHRAAALSALLLALGLVAPTSAQLPEPESDESAGWELYMQAVESYQKAPDGFVESQCLSAWLAGDVEELERLMPLLEAHLDSNAECTRLLREAAQNGARPPQRDGPDVDSWAAFADALAGTGPPPEPGSELAGLTGELGELARKMHGMMTGEASAITQPGVGLPTLGSFRQMARLGSVRACHAHINGKPEEALSQAMDTYALGATLTHGELVDWLTGVAIISMAASVQDGILNKSDGLDPELLEVQADAVAKLLGSCSLADVAVREANQSTAYWHSSYEHAKLTQTDQVPGEWTPASDDEVELLRAVDQWFMLANSTMVEEAQKPVWEMDAEALYARLSELPQPDASAWGVDDLAELLWLNPDLVSAYRRYLNEFAGHEWALRLEAHKASDGRYPVSLDDLKPQFDGPLPVDSWSGLPLIYRPFGEGYVLYGVGPDGTDNGGASDGTRRSVAPDHVVRSVPG